MFVKFIIKHLTYKKHVKYLFASYRNFEDTLYKQLRSDEIVTCVAMNAFL